MKTRNNTLDFLKCLACCAVLFMHTNSGTMVESVVVCLCRFAVPLFFMISGYYIYNSDTSTVQAKTLKKIWKTLKLGMVASLVYGLYYSFMYPLLYDDKSYSFILETVFEKESILKFFILNKTVLGGTIWFVFALLYCYILLLFINKYNMYKIAYILSLFLIIIHIISRGIIQHYNIVEETINVDYYRNWLFMGFPFFFLGNAVNAKGEKIKDIFSNKQLLIIILVGLLVSCVERYFVPLEIYFGTTAAVTCMFIYAIKNPSRITFKPAIVVGAKYSMFIYIMHPIINSIVSSFHITNVLLIRINPLVIFTATLIFGIIFYKIIDVVKK